MLRLKFNRLQFYGLPETMSHGSLELLIALSFLISSGLLDVLVKDAYKKSIFNPKIEDELFYGQSQAGVTFEDTNEDNFDDVVIWCQGRLKLNEKFIQTYCVQMKKLTEKVGKVI